MEPSCLAVFLGLQFGSLNSHHLSDWPLAVVFAAFAVHDPLGETEKKKQNQKPGHLKELGLGL